MVLQKKDIHLGVQVRGIHLAKRGLHSAGMQLLLCLVVTWYGKVQLIISDVWVLF